jgi:vitamin B12/bleomycin/antimicrobial peptide transport system ATP-binding/permease protein
MQNTGFLKAFWALTKPFWVSEKRAVGITLLVTVVGLALMAVYMEVQFNQWNADFYNTLQDKDQAEFYRQLGKFTLLAFTWIVIVVYQRYFQQMLLIEWRTWLTERFLADWLRDQAHYRMQLTDRKTDNPDQRIAEDLRIFVEYTLSLSLGLLSAVVTLVSFIAILWALSGAFTLFGVHIPGYMVWAALIYAVVGSVLTHLVGRPLIGLDFNQQRFEADFRFSLVRLRENSEGVALYRGEQEELGGLRQRFAAVVGNWWKLMLKQKQLTWLTSFYGQLAIIFPLVVASPRFFAGQVQLGHIFQTASAFGQVQGSLSWFISAYRDFAMWKATVDRLIGFAEAVSQAHEQARQPQGERVEGDERLSLEQLALQLPQGGELLANTSLELVPGKDVLVTGPSGSGKSTLLRALAGIWPYWKGRIRMPKGAKLLFLPQKPYLPIGSLKRAVSYPDDPAKFSYEDVLQALDAVGLPHLKERLERSENWAQLLSGGEQQRLAFARALLYRPDWLFLDEATASLPDADQDRLYRLLKERLPETTLVSIGHREALAVHHDQRLVFGSGQLRQQPG